MYFLLVCSSVCKLWFYFFEKLCIFEFSLPSSSCFHLTFPHCLTMFSYCNTSNFLKSCISVLCSYLISALSQQLKFYIKILNCKFHMSCGNIFSAEFSSLVKMLPFWTFKNISLFAFLGWLIFVYCYKLNASAPPKSLCSNQTHKIFGGGTLRGDKVIRV